MAQDVRVFVSSHPCMRWAFSLTSLTSPSPSSSSSHFSSSSSSSFYPSTSPRLSSKIPCALRQGDGVYWRVLQCIPQMTRFRDAKVCNNLVTEEIDDHRIQSDYKCIIGQQNPEGKNSTLGIASAWWNRATRRTTPMTTWPPRPRALSAQRTWTSTRELMHAWSHVRISQVLVVMICTPHRGSSLTCARLSCHPCMQWSFLFDFELSISSNFFFFFSFIFNLLQSLLHFFHNLEGSSNTAYFAWKEMDSTDEACLLTGYEPKNYDLMETYVKSFTESLTHPQFSEQRFLEDMDYDDTAHEEMLHNAHRVHVCHSQREGLSVGQSSSSVSERTGRPVEERTGRLVMASGQELNVGKRTD